MYLLWNLFWFLVHAQSFFLVFFVVWNFVFFSKVLVKMSESRGWDAGVFFRFQTLEIWLVSNWTPQMKVVGLVLIQNYFDFGFFRMVLNLDSFKSGFDCVKIVVFERKKTSEYSEFIRHRNVDLVQEIISLSLYFRRLIEFQLCMLTMFQKEEILSYLFLVFCTYWNKNSFLSSVD